MERGTEIELKNNKYLTPVIFEFVIRRSSNRINIYERHKKLFVATKLVDNTTAIISNSGKNINIQKKSHSDETMSKDSHQKITYRNIVKIIVCCKVESSIRMNELQYDGRFIIYRLFELNTYLKYNKLSTHQEDSIR